MNDIIHLLPESVANQIAAGEVIQRPASVVKELVENSIDAGATTVQIIIKDAGRTLIQVIDDGCGMSVTDARMAFERHATSKINQATDLYALHTMGFRGEALPSIAAVSEIELRTMRRDDQIGTRVMISASKVESQQPEACVAGTNLMVKRLFFNLPARRKFLKKDPVELGHIVREFERLALVNPRVAFTLKNNDVVLHQLSPSSLKERIVALFGKNLEHQLIPISTETSLAKIDGFISLPQNARRKGALQYFFVNGRNMRHPYFHKAVVNCYQDLISADSQPNYFINFTVDPDTIDVNIHPQKHEIKFENEQPLWQILVAAVRESLGKFNVVPAIDFESVEVPEIPAFAPKDPGRAQHSQAPNEGYDPHYNPFDTKRNAPTDWQKLYEGFMSGAGTPSAVTTTPAQPKATELPGVVDDTEPEVGLKIFQLAGRYIVTPSRSALLIIDQHRAHVRILFERFSTMMNEGAISAQRLMFPDAVTLEPSLSVIAQSVIPTLNNMGFDISSLGNHSYSINGVPPMLGKVSPVDALTDIINTIREQGDDPQFAQWQLIALSMAKSAAIKRGTTLSAEEMDTLVADLMRLATPAYTPDGHVVFQQITIDEIAKKF